MGRNYRRSLREREMEPSPLGRPPLPDPLDSLRSGWRRATVTQRAKFMAEAGLSDVTRETPTDRPVGLEGR